jgi:hypothetical protein
MVQIIFILLFLFLIELLDNLLASMIFVSFIVDNI